MVLCVIIRDDNDRRIFFRKASEIDLFKRVWVFEAKPYKKNTSAETKAYIWSTIYPAIRKHILNSTGHNFTPEEIHESMKAKFIDGEHKVVCGEDIMVRTITGKQEVTSKYIDDMKNYWSENELIIPDAIS